MCAPRYNASCRTCLPRQPACRIYCVLTCRHAFAQKSPVFRLQGAQCFISLDADSGFHQILLQPDTWAARYNTWLLIKLTPKGIVFSFLSFLAARQTKDSLQNSLWPPSVQGFAVCPHHCTGHIPGSHEQGLEPSKFLANGKVNTCLHR